MSMEQCPPSLLWSPTYKANLRETLRRKRLKHPPRAIHLSRGGIEVGSIVKNPQGLNRYTCIVPGTGATLKSRRVIVKSQGVCITSTRSAYCSVYTLFSFQLWVRHLYQIFSSIIRIGDLIILLAKKAGWYTLQCSGVEWSTCMSWALFSFSGFVEHAAHWRCIGR